ncbi:VOC family protein [Bacillus sp. JJ1521]|uniref:VOC family protein n=1 Tax=Bacillus sp. JJ1521 TaxID=3122957 RepID=UPI003000E67B
MTLSNAKQKEVELTELDLKLSNVAHIGHASINVTNLERSTWFFTEVLGLHVSAEENDKVYLRAWQDWDHHTLVLNKADQSGLDHFGWRVNSEKSLYAFEKTLKESGTEYKWIEGGTELGQGDAIKFHSPAGIPVELYWEMEKYSNPLTASKLPSHPMKYTGVGAAPRRFDHVNVMVDDVAKEQEWWTNFLGIHHRYYIQNEADVRLGSWLSKTNIAHEIALMRNSNQTGALLHHVAYFLDSPDELLRALNIMAENDIKIEWGPGKHGTSGAQFLYAFEPSGNRVELWTGGMLIFAPDWEPIEWQSGTGQFGLDMWGSTPPKSYLTYGTEIKR